jgi:hypothetical protein
MGGGEFFSTTLSGSEDSAPTATSVAKSLPLPKNFILDLGDKCEPRLLGTWNLNLRTKKEEEVEGEDRLLERKAKVYEERWHGTIGTRATGMLEKFFGICRAHLAAWHLLQAALRARGLHARG